MDNEAKSFKRSSWNSKRTDDIEKLIIKDYQNGMTGKLVAEKYGYKRKETVYSILEKYGICRKPSKVYTNYSEDYFKKINSHEKAYILGLIMTDGYIIKDYRGFGIQLTKDDGYILEKISKIIGSNTCPLSINYNKKRLKNENIKDMIRLVVTNQKISEDLRNLGVIRNKSKILRYTSCVPKKYLSSFFRGLIDGDGSIGIAKSNNIWCQIASASELFINDIMSLDLPVKFSLNKSISKYNGKETKMYVARVCGGNNESIKFLKWIYKDKGDLYLRRKYEKLQDKIS